MKVTNEGTCVVLESSACLADPCNDELYLNTGIGKIALVNRGETHFEAGSGEYRQAVAGAQNAAGMMAARYPHKPMGRRTVPVLGAAIDSLSWDEALSRIEFWADQRESRYVCNCNVHSVVTATYDEAFRQVVNGADMATPDGMPVALMMRLLGLSGQARINGPDLMWKYCAVAEARGQSVFFLGSKFETLAALRARLAVAFPRLRIAGMYSPPFRALSADEDEAIVAEINDSGANVLFVSYGCPKQETWMAEHRDRIHAVMIGVGAAFGYHAGTLKRAPLWMQRVGLEWLHRLASEPNRLWKRYLVTNTLFVVSAAMQLCFRRKLSKAAARG